MFLWIHNNWAEFSMHQKDHQITSDVSVRFHLVLCLFSIDVFWIGLRSRLTLSWMAVKTINTKVIRRFMLNHVLYYHFSEKQPWKTLFHFQFGLLFFDICCLFWQNGAWPPVVGAWRRTRQQNKCQKKVEIKSWITFSMVVFWENG